MKVLELFAGTCSVSNAFKARGHEVFTVDWSDEFDVNLHADIGQLTASEIIDRFGRPDVIWASPDCTTYSVAAISKHRRRNPVTGSLDPITDYARRCDETNQHVLELIKELKPKYYFIENPRGAMRKMSWMQDLQRYTVTYCKYGEERMKPTDIWTNHPDPKFLPPSKNGDKDHVAAPRGSRTGTQGIKGSRDRARIPKLLCEHIVDICEGEQKKRYTVEVSTYSIYLVEVNADDEDAAYEYAAANFVDDGLYVDGGVTDIAITKCEEKA